MRQIAWSILNLPFSMRMENSISQDGWNGKNESGQVEYLGEHACRFSADVYDASELIPWIRTFICRITDISISNKSLEIQFKEDLQAMYEMYGLEGEK